MILILARQLAIDFIAWSAIAYSVRAAALDHEIRNNPVESEAIIKIMLREVNKVFNSFRRIFFEELDLHNALFGMDFCYFHEGKNTPKYTNGRCYYLIFF